MSLTGRHSKAKAAKVATQTMNQMVDDDQINIGQNTARRLTSELPLPVNTKALPYSDDPASFGPLGVGSISFGPFVQAALAQRATEFLARWG